MPNINGAEKIDIGSLPDQQYVRNLDGSKKSLSKQIYIGGAVIIIAGILTGYILSSSLSKGNLSSSVGTKDGQTGSGKSVGSADTKTFPDSAEGDLEAGGINGEGTHKLIRPGGDNQTVYLTSSVLDLNQFVGKKVKIWGQTFSAKKAGWLMDVGRVEVL